MIQLVYSMLYIIDERLVADWVHDLGNKSSEEVWD
jgi:hypothetical protein